MKLDYNQRVFKRRGVKEPPRVPPGQDRISTPIPAPGNLEAIQSFVNTADHDGDGLRTPRDLTDLLARLGLLPADTALGADDLERARLVRRGLRALMHSHAGGDTDEDAVAQLGRAAAGTHARVRFDPEGATHLELVGRDFDDALGTLLGFVHEARCTGQWTSLKLCANPECRKSFFDFTKSHTGKWCTRRCGDRIRARAFRRSPKYRSGY